MPNKLSKELLQSIASYIEENYVEACDYSAVEKICSRRRDMGRSKSAPLSSRAPMAAAKPVSLEDMLKQEDAGFTETLLKLIDKTGKKDSEIYKKANISKQHFSKIRNNPHYRPTKPTAVALALALELNLEETRDLIGRAGYALTNSSTFDLIIRYFIEHQQYNVIEINIALYEFDQSMLGA